MTPQYRYYHTTTKARIFGDRKCKSCHILLKSKHGAKKTRNYCRDCRDNGAAYKHYLLHKKDYYRQNRATILLKAKERYANKHTHHTP